MAFLHGVRVLDLSDSRALLTGRILADLGADVVHVEPPTGSPARRATPRRGAGSYLWDTFAAGSRSVVADVDNPVGRATVLALASVADVLVMPSSPRELDVVGLGEKTLASVNPALIQVAVTPFGLTGPKADWAASDLTVWASGGPLDPHRDDARAPVRISVPQAFAHASADAADGVLMALLARRRTGRGQTVDVSAQASLTTATLGQALASAVGDANPGWDNGIQARGSVDQSGSGAGTDPVLKKWRCRDGLIELHLAIGAAAGAFTTAFFEWMRDEGARVERFADIDWCRAPRLLETGKLTDDDLAEARSAVATFLAGKSKSEVLRAALERRLVAVPIYETDEIHVNPQAAARHTFTTVGEGDRATRIQSGFAVVNRDAFRIGLPAPRIGEHHHEVLGEWLHWTPRQTASGAEPFEEAS
ncbi:CoA transferase [Gordonia sp. (in: high G+C Gram-positive bacteria)]|uniref:CoA transferase n=1 Tax=Gordonia sp. (in: high G+C Gram-positive bacteria) TaxID=84139 RepID=UPI003F9929B5